MQELTKLVKGYKQFLKHNYHNHEERYRTLAEEGQTPKIMMIGCSDSRVNPDFIFNTSPGDLFVVRNVANLVPPYEVDDSHHGTSAALEFAVNHLKVSHIVVMGHSLCGGIKACCDNLHTDKPQGLFIPKWMAILEKCARNALKENSGLAEEDFHRVAEQAGITQSLENLKSFPFILEKIKSGTLHIHGAYFEIKRAQLYAYDQLTHEFLAIE